MRIEDFPRPPHDNGRGLHWSARVYHPTKTRAPLDENDTSTLNVRVFRPNEPGTEPQKIYFPTVNWSATFHQPTKSELEFWIDELRAMNIRWVKLLDDGGGSSIDVCQRLLDVGIMPIVRLFKERPNPNGVSLREYETVEKLVKIGVRYFETNNEPDLPAEWQRNRMPENWLDIVVDNFIRDADEIIKRGGLPAVPAMGPGGRDNVISRIVDRERADLFERGAWVAIHNYTLNHPLDYPYDAVNQLGEPLTQEEYERHGLWAWDNRARESDDPKDMTINRLRAENRQPGRTVFDDPNCFRGYEAIGKMIFDALGFYVPVISTEGGPVVGWGDDKRYNKLTPQQHMDMQLEIVRRMQNNETPPWYFAMCTWLIASRPLGDFTPAWESMSWYTHFWDEQFGLHGQLPVVDALKKFPSVARVWPAGTDLTASLNGRVQRADDSVSAGARLRLQAEGHAVIQTTTNADGSYKFENLAPAKYTLRAPNGTIIRQEFTLTAGEQKKQDVKLNGKAAVSAVSGRVLRPGNHPYVGAIINLLKLDKDKFHPTAQAQVLGEGKFRFEQLDAGTYALQVEETMSEPVELDGWNEAERDVNVPPPRKFRYKLLSAHAAPGSPRRIHGSVVNEAGEGVNGIQMEMFWEDPEPDTEFPTIETGHDRFKPEGSYEFLASAGEFKIKVIEKDWPSDETAVLSTRTVEGQRGNSFVWEVDFLLEEIIFKESVVRGRITNPPTNGVMVLSGGALAEQPQRQPLDANGRFEFKELLAGADYELTLENVARLGAPFALNGVNTVTRNLALTGALEGIAYGLSTDADVILTRLSPLGWRRTQKPDAKGAYRFENLPPGRYQIAAGDKQSDEIVLEEGKTFSVPIIPVIPLPQSVIHGVIKTDSGKLVGDAQVELQLENRVVGVATSDEAGEFEFTELKAGDYNVELPAYELGSPVTLDGLETITLTILVPDEEEKPQLAEYILFARTAGAQSSIVQNQLRLIYAYLAAHPETTLGFDADEAAFAERVILVGDTNLLPEQAEKELRAAGHTVERVGTDLYKLAAWLRKSEKRGGLQ